MVICRSNKRQIVLMKGYGPESFTGKMLSVVGIKL